MPVSVLPRCVRPLENQLVNRLFYLERLGNMSTKKSKRMSGLTARLSTASTNYSSLNVANEELSRLQDENDILRGRLERLNSTFGETNKKLGKEVRDLEVGVDYYKMILGAALNSLAYQQLPGHPDTRKIITDALSEKNPGAVMWNAFSEMKQVADDAVSQLEKYQNGTNNEH